jgi:hypothetical protein
MMNISDILGTSEIDKRRYVSYPRDINVLVTSIGCVVVVQVRLAPNRNSHFHRIYMMREKRNIS